MVALVSAAEFSAWLESTIWGGKNATRGYIWGAMGEKCTPAMRTEWARRAPSQAATINGTGAKWDGKKCDDCSGIRRDATRNYWKPYESGGATTMFNKYMVAVGRIDTLPQTRVVLVFRAKKLANGTYSDTEMAHVGYYMGDGTVIHAKGTAHGVVREKLSAGTWTHWGADKMIAYEINIPGGNQIAPPEEQGGTEMLYKGRVISSGALNVRKGPSTTYAKLGTVKNGDIVEILAVDAKTGWYKLRSADGKLEGWASNNFVEKIAGTEPAPPPAGLGKGVYVPQAAWDAMMAAAVPVGEA